MAMASPDITELLKSQERAYKGAMEVMVTNLTQRIHALETTVSALTASLEFSQQEIDELKKDMKDNDKEKLAAKKTIESLTDQLESSKQIIRNMEERINYQDDYSRRHNIRISGMAESVTGETWEQTAVMVSSLLADKLQLPDVQLERAHRVGQRREDRPRPIVARFTRYCDREAAMRNARRLRGTNIYLNDDLCAASQSIKNAQMPQLKQARASGKIAYFRHTKLIVKDRPVTGQPSVSEAPSTPDRDQQQQHKDASEALDGTANEDRDAVDGARYRSGGGQERAGVVQASSSLADPAVFPPLPPSAGRAGSPAARASPHSRSQGAASPPRSQEVKKNPKRNAKRK